MKRLFDIVITLLISSGVLPVIAIVSILSLCLQGRPVFFVQVRVGRNGKNFKLFKFRTMVANAESVGSRVTVGGDARITPLGQWLRRGKLDELPQFWNVLKGDMSLVGPRPEVEEYVNLYNANQRRVLQLRPGITDLASLKYFDESEQLVRAKDPKQFYVDVIMPDKLAINLDYLEKANVLTDLKIIFATALRVFGFRQKQKEA